MRRSFLYVHQLESAAACILHAACTHARMHACMHRSKTVSFLPPQLPFHYLIHHNITLFPMIRFLLQTALTMNIPHHTVVLHCTLPFHRWVACKYNGHEASYRGSLASTASGKKCQKWSSQTPHEHTRTAFNFPMGGLGNHNSCRNPDGEASPWCYTTDPGTEWEPCNVCSQCVTTPDPPFTNTLFSYKKHKL